MKYSSKRTITTKDDMTDDVVVTGVNGFVGKHLARELHSLGVRVIGVGTDESVDPEISEVVGTYHQADLTQTWPDLSNVKAIIHLAGLAVVGPSYESPQLYINANSAMVTNLCEYYLKQPSKPRIVILSSGTVYDASQPMPITEAGELNYASPYAVSKVLNENQAKYYRNRGLDCVVVRPFNHIGPGQVQGFILPDFYERIRNTKENSITVGNINTRRDYTDVRDIVRAHASLALAQKLQYDTYNVCSGKSLAGSDILDKLKVAMKRPDITFEIDPTLVRPTDIQEIVGDSSRLRNELQWEPKYTIGQTIADFIDSQT